MLFGIPLTFKNSLGSFLAKILNPSYYGGFKPSLTLDTPPIILHQFERSRSGAHPLNFLADFQGDAMMVDQYSGYKKLFQKITGLDELGCNAHARRKFFDLYLAHIWSPSVCQACFHDFKQGSIAAIYPDSDRGCASGP